LSTGKRFAQDDDKKKLSTRVRYTLQEDLQLEEVFTRVRAKKGPGAHTKIAVGGISSKAGSLNASFTVYFIGGPEVFGLALKFHCYNNVASAFPLLSMRMMFLNNELYYVHITNLV